MQNINVFAIQTDLFWANPLRNVQHIEDLLPSADSHPDLIVLPEMFSTGFNMSPEECFETMEGATVAWMIYTAKRLNSVVAGSLLIKEEGSFYNRFIWASPDGTMQTYDKKHLFRLAGEHEIYTGGLSRVIVPLKNFRFLLQICYDLRFPLWCRNSFNEGQFEYDGVIFVANWPAARSHIWKTLLKARAIENIAYVIGVNRTGKDANGTGHSGDSAIISYKGDIITEATPYKDDVLKATLNMEELSAFRESFPAAYDWDKFDLVK